MQKDAKYISDIVGDEYQEWIKGTNKVNRNPGGNIIFMNAPTGSGKTYFIFNIFLPFCASNGLRILYLVNRRILKDQLEKYLEDNYNLPRNNIKIASYQYIEELLRDKNVNNKNNNNEKVLNSLANYDVVVCDECHYFLADSLFNTYTYDSYLWIYNYFMNKPKIFMSATIDDIRNVIKGDYIINGNNQILLKDNYNGMEFVIGRLFDYSLERKYDYNIHLLKSREDIVNKIIENREEKWLVFVDSIEFGKKLKTEIKKGLKRTEEIKKEKIVLLTANYENDTDAIREKIVIQKREMQNADILIATSVLDNGINLKDVLLKNIVVLADNKAEFLQMLGRKRREFDEKVNLYIYKYDLAYFKKRYSYLLFILNYNKAFLRNNIMYSQNKYLKNGKDFGLDCLGKILELFCTNQLDFNKIKKMYYCRDNVLFMSNFSEKQISNLLDFYKKISCEFGDDVKDYEINEKTLNEEDCYNEEELQYYKCKDDYAFVKEQLRWLGWDEDQISNWVNEQEKSNVDKALESLTKDFKDKLKENNGKYITKEQNRMIKENCNEDIILLIKSISDDKWRGLPKELQGKEKNKLIDDLKKYKRDSRSIPDKVVNIISYCYSDFPYDMGRCKDGRFNINSKNDN